MAVRSVVDASTLGRYVAERVAGDDRVSGLWVEQRPGIVETWLAVEPMDMADELTYFDIPASLLDAFPGTHFEFHVINPRHYREGYDPLNEIPPTSVRLLPA